MAAWVTSALPETTNAVPRTAAKIEQINFREANACIIQLYSTNQEGNDYPEESTHIDRCHNRPGQPVFTVLRDFKEKQSGCFPCQS